MIKSINFQLIFLGFLISFSTFAQQKQVNLLDSNFQDFYTSDSLFLKPYVDVDEWRESPCKHRYVHGGFTGTNTRFSFYFPPRENFKGHFFQYITPIPESENLSQRAETLESDKILFSIVNGAYFIETNGGGRLDFANPMAQDPTIGAFRANAASAQFSKLIAREIFNVNRVYGYAFGGSGGSLRTIGSIENTDGIWDGAVPYVMPTPMSIPNSFTIAILANRVLGRKMKVIMDALRPGSNKSVLELLETKEEKEVYQEVKSLGFPPGAWRMTEGSELGGFSVIYPSVKMMDSGYFSDFWTKPGYEGYKPSLSLSMARTQVPARITKLITAKEAMELKLKYDPYTDQTKGLADNAWKALLEGNSSDSSIVAVELDKTVDFRSTTCELFILNGNQKSMTLPFQRVEGKIVIFSNQAYGATKELKEGTSLVFDNSNLLAVQYYHRHQVPSKEYYVYNQYRNEKGDPIPAQRPMLLGPIFASAASGSIPSGKFKGKMIIIQNMNDGGAFPWHADWYRNQAKKQLGAEADKNLRIWYTENANHGDYPSQPDPTRDIVYLGVLQQALLDLSDWVENEKEPSKSTSYILDEGQIILPQNSTKRGGIQASVLVRANGKERLITKSGKKVKFKATVFIPEGTGSLVSASWSPEGIKEFSKKQSIRKGKTSVKFIHTFSKPGTYFPTVLIETHRNGEFETPFSKIQNLGTARVIVE